MVIPEFLEVFLFVYQTVFQGVFVNELLSLYQVEMVPLVLTTGLVVKSGILFCSLMTLFDVLVS